MRVLSVVGRGYYASRHAVEPMYHYFTLPLRELGHEVHHFDHVDIAARDDQRAATDQLDHLLTKTDWDLVLYQHAPTKVEPIDTAMLRTHKDRTCIAAWNSDDDWQWPVTGPRAPDFTYMVTTYPQVFAAQREAVPNLVLSQWGCLGTFAAPETPKDIDFSFAGFIYKNRVAACKRLARTSGLQTFGKGARQVRLRIPNFKGIDRFPFLVGPPVDFTRINDIWNRSRVSYTPLDALGGPVLSLKSRLFDMGLSGTVGLCQLAPHLADYYEPGSELVIFEDLDDCAEQAAALLADEKRRAKIAAAYAARTKAEHMWTHRFAAMFRDFGLA